MKNMYLNLTQMLQGCSKRNGMTVSASMHDDGQSCDGNRQSRLMSLSGPLSFRSRYLRYAAVIFCVLAMNVGQAWGADFSLAVKTSVTTTSVASNSTLALNTTNHLSTLSGGTVTLKNTNNSAYDMIKVQSSNGAICMGSDTHYFILTLDNAIAVGDEISFTSTGSQYICFTTSETRNNTYKVSPNGTNKLTITTGNALIGKTTIYVWRGGGNTYVNSLTITSAGGGCSAPAAPTIGGTATYTSGETITITASCASGADASTTYTWYKGADWATAKAGSAVQTAKTAAAGGTTYSKASCVVGDAGIYWCEASNGSGCESHNSTGKTITVSAGGGGGSGEEVTATWPMVSGSSLTLVGSADHASVTPSNALKEGENISDLTDVFDASFTDYTGKMAKVTASGTIGSSESVTNDHYLKFTLTVASGYTFTPTGFSAIVARNGTNNAYTQVVLKQGSTTIKATEVSQPNRSGKSVAKSVYSAEFDDASTYSAGTAIDLYIYFGGGMASGKNFGVLAVSVTGTYEAVTPSCTAPNHVDISGNYHFFPGETLALTATAYSTAGTSDPIAAGDITGYQWQKYIGSDWADIVGETSATYTKANATTSDVGQYRCIVSTGATCSTTSGTFNAKCLQLYVYWDNKSDKCNLPFTKVDGTHATVNVSLENGSYTYYYKVTDGCGNWWGNDGTMTSSNCSGWNLNVNNHCGLTTTKAAAYTFNLTYNAGVDAFSMSVVYPSTVQQGGYNLYFANDERNWSNIHYRIGRSNWNSKAAMTLVPGTANLYQTTTIHYESDGGFDAWHIANNGGWSDGNSIYKTKTGDGNAITNATRFEGAPVPSTGLTVIPGSDHSTGGDDQNNNCEFYSYTTVPGMLRDRVTISQPSNGTVTVSYTREDGVHSSFTAAVADMNEDLAHTVIITPTATPAEGYTLSGLTVNGAPHTSGNTYTVTANTTIAATFSPASYTVTLNTNDGTINAGNVTSYTYGTGATLPTNVTKDGHRFMGWYDNEGFTGSAVTTIANDATGDKTYWAKWAQVYTITNGTPANGTITISKSSAIEGEAVTISVEANTGYTFNVWNIYKTSDAGTTVSPAAASASTSFTMPAYNVTVDATFNAKTTTITINANTSYHGSTTPGSVTATYGNALPLFTAATGESGWNLTGYFTTATSGTKVINADGTLVASTDYADASGNWKYESATLTLYAQYEEAEAGCIDANSTNFGEGNSSGDASKTLDDGTVVAMYKCTNSASSVSIGGNILFTAPTGKAFETFSFVATCGSDSKTNHYKINGGSQQNLESSTTTSKRYTITVPASPNTTTIQIIKNGTTPAVTEFCYTYKDVCATPTTAFADGAYTVGGSALDLSTLISGKQGSGAITYTVKNANGTGAAIAGTSFTATSAGTATVTATQAANGDYCEKVMDATITVSAAPAGDCHKYFYYGVLSAPSPAPTKNEDSFFSSVPSSGSSASESWEIDDVTYTTSSRCSNSNNIGTFTIPSGKVATMYVMFNGSSSYTMTITKGGSNYKTGIDASSGIKKYTEEDMGPGTYAVTTTGNVGLYLLIVDVCDATPCTVEPTVSATTKGTTTSSTQVVNCAGISSLGTGTCTITSYGFVYGTSANPTLSDSHVEVGTSYTVTGTAFAETTLTGLTPSTTYYVRAYATNGAGTGYGDAVSFTTSAAPAGAPVITVQPTLSEVALGETASFSLTATGATSYQWYSCDSEGENRVEASGTSAITDNYSYTTTATGTTYYICKVSNASGDTWSEVVGSIVNPVSFTIHYEAGSTDKTSYTTETFTQNKVVNAEVADYIGSLTKFAFNGVEISDKGKKGTMSMQISMPTSEDVGKYVSFTFTVAPNYYLSVDNINIQCQPVGNDNHNYKVVLTDALGTTITGTSSTNTKGELNSINFPAAQLSGKRLVGLVTVKIFGWYSSSDTYRLAKDTYITGTVSSLPAPTASWTARPASATVGDGGKTYTLTTDGTNTVAWSITDQSGAIGATLSAPSGLSTTLSGYTTAGSLYVQASVTGDGIHYLSTPATLLRQRVVISADCEETTLISATLSSGSGTGAVTGTLGGTSAVSFTSVKEVDGGYKMGGDGSYVYLTLSGDENFAANDEVKITITKASDQGDGALHIYKYASETWTELGSVTAAGAGTYSYTLTETNVSTAFNTIGLYRTGSNQNPYVKALSVVRNSCSASKPSSVTVTASPAGPYAIDDALTLTVEATNADTYQWYSNTNNTASDGFLLVGETATTYSPSTAIAGTTYYYCVATNASGSTVSNIITVTVNSAKTAPTVSWTDTDESPNYGGGGYAVKATVSTAEWDGTLTTDMLTASDGVTLTGVSVSGKVITATYGVTETARSPLSFSLTLPETTNYTALAANKEITFDRCGEGAVIETTETKLPVNSSYTTASNPTYRWETAGVGWLTLVTGSSTLSSTSDSYSGFSYRSNSGKSSITFYSELDAVSAVRIYIKGGGPTTLSKVQKGTTLGKYTKLTPSTDYDYLYSNGSSSIESREQGYIEITFKTALSANTFVEITLSRNTEYYGVGLITGNSEVGNIPTALSWATDPGTTVDKKTTDANFRYEAVKASDAASQATLGTISYKSSVPAVATVSATGVVDILGVGNTTITATLASSGCYKKATLSYNLVVAEATCTDDAGTITASGSGITIDGNTVTKADACAAVTLTVSGHTGEDAGATYQWYKDGVSMGESYRSKSISVTANGDYTVEVTNDGGEHCTMPATNTITITGNAISITKIVDEWYVKNGRRTPDIALATIEGTTSYTVNDGISDITTFAGCGFELRDGILYLKGTQDDGSAPSGLTSGDATLTITAVSACGDDPTATITIHKQVETAKPSIAFIVDGTSGDPVNSVATTKTSSRPIWVYLSTYFDLTGCNAYWTNNEKQIRQYYSQFDAIVITDDPSTDAKPKSGLKYVNALGTMVDVRPILTMEAYVGKYGASSNWHIGGTPSSPNPRQYELKLQCKDHDIFSDLTPSANFRSEEIGGETYYYVTMVDNSVTPYAGLADDAETETYPALQGFSAASIKGTGMLGIGTISDGTLQGGVERQDEQTARMMILGIQHQAMAALTSEGKQVIKNAINYLLKTDMEEVDDCSNYFIGGTVGHEQEWHTASNWSSTKVPDASTKARIMAPVTISTTVHVAQVDIAVDGKSIHYDSGNTDCSGSVTIAPTGALIVDGQVRRTTNGRLFTEDELQPTTPADLTILSSSEAQGALIFDNSEGETQATVVVHSSANKAGSTRNWQYLTSPLQETPVTEFFYGVGTYTYKHSEADGGWVRYNLGTAFNAFDAIGLTQEDAKDFVFYGPLAPTGEWNLSLTHAHSGNNLFGNSWTAPIDLKALVRNTDFDGNIDLDLAIYNTGADQKNGSGEFVQEDNADNTPGTWHHIPLRLATLDGGGWTGMTVIPAYQAFQLKATASATLTIGYDKCVRGSESKNYTEPLRAPRRRSAGRADSDIEALRLAVSDAKGIAYIYLLEGEQFTEGYDNGWELAYTANSKYGKLYAISPAQGDMMALARPSLEGTMVGFQRGQSNEYTITFNETEGYYYLNDLKMEQSTLIQAGESYTFSVEEGESANRFLISSVPFNKPDIVTGVTNLDAEAPKVQKVIYNDKLYIIRGGKVFSADGQLVK